MSDESTRLTRLETQNTEFQARYERDRADQKEQYNKILNKLDNLEIAQNLLKNDKGNTAIRILATICTIILSLILGYVFTRLQIK